MEKLFSFENADDFRNELVKGLNFPFVSCNISTLGGRENIAILLAISHEAREKWHNGIFENSPYRRFDIDNKGNVENFTSRYTLKHIRKFKAKSISHLIEKLNNIKG